MLQQTTVAAVKDYYARFLSLWPSVQDLAAAEDARVMAEWAGLGYYARARNLLKCARAVAALGGFPTTEADLRELPGIGPYTAAAVAAIAFGEQTAVVDGNVERLISRLFALETPPPKLKDQVRVIVARLTPADRPGDFAQAMMDMGATICTPKSPACLTCPVAHRCQARAEGRATAFPVRAAKVATPRRKGFAYVARRADGALLVERRPDKGLLGGMLGFPGSPWGATAEDTPPFAANWSQAGEVEHTFTHFHLTLSVLIADVHGPNTLEPLHSPTDLPSLMRKVHDVALRAFA
jgi:A/G-specific adenine glycosylase